MVRAKKRLGQHFLKDEGIARSIAESLTHHGAYRKVIEIGPGTGALTRHLMDRDDIDLLCVELDREAAAHLRRQYPALHLVEADFLTMDLTSHDGSTLAVIGNFPYNISTEIVFKVLEHRDRITELVGMFQKEVADRLAAPPGSRTYGITSVLAQAYYRIEQLFLVEPGSFIPPPRVRSAVIRMQRNEVAKLDCDEAVFRSLVKTAFNQRRKQLGNALRSFPGLEAGLPGSFATLRAERLSVADFVTLTRASTAQAPTDPTGSSA